MSDRNRFFQRALKKHQMFEKRQGLILTQATSDTWFVVVSSLCFIYPEGGKQGHANPPIRYDLSNQIRPSIFDLSPKSGQKYFNYTQRPQSGPKKQMQKYFQNPPIRLPVNPPLPSMQSATLTLIQSLNECKSDGMSHVHMRIKYNIL